MGSQWGADKYYKRAVSEGYRSRAAYKLRDIQNRFSIIRHDDNVIDLGAAPGSWMQVLRELTDGEIIGIDLNPIAPIEGTRTITGDFTTDAVQQKVRAMAGEVNVVVCDASPKLSGQKAYDQARAVALSEIALIFATKVLKPGGNFAVKSFQGEMFNELLELARENFYSVKVYRSHAARKGSTEVYIVGKNFKGNMNVA